MITNGGHSLMDNRINASAFLSALRHTEAECRDQIQRHYTHHPKRTAAMLGSEGVMPKVCERLSKQTGHALEYKQEWYTIDALFVSGKELIYPDSDADSKGHRLWYPSKLDVIVEHENDEKIEEELWKLLFWHAGLKVLIGYDYCENEFSERLGRDEQGRRKGDWAPQKLTKLREMLRAVHGTERSDAEYLLILGNREAWNRDTPVKWRWCRIDKEGDALRPLDQD